MARGIALRGLAVSSPSTAAASKPINEVKLKMVAKNTPETPPGSAPNENGVSEMPEPPPFATITTASTSTASMPSAASTSCVRVDTRMSKKAKRKSATSSTQKKTNQWMEMLRLAKSVERKME